MIKSQRNLFNIPDDVAYLNTAYMSPLLNSVITSIDGGARLKSQPWRLSIPDFYEHVDQARLLFSKLIALISGALIIKEKGKQVMLKRVIPDSLLILGRAII